jgi:DNA polymerase III subunit epsilon
VTEVRAIALDSETTGIDVFEDRIIQFVISTLDKNGDILETHEWRANPGIEVPEGAAEVHGFTTEIVRTFPAIEDLLPEIQASLESYRNVPWCLYNANYDLSLLTAEIERHLGDGVAFAKMLESVRVVDALVIERHYNRYRKGKKRLMDVAPHYGIVVEEDRLHEAGYDVELTAKVAAAQITKYGMPTNDEQAAWHREWATDFQKYMRSLEGNEDVTIETEWPLRLKEEA